MSEMITVGEAIARTLEQYNVEAIYGVISIHNLPVADAIGQRGNIRFVPARGEAGSVTMADAHGRFSGLGVALTSTGAGAGNAVGALVEAMNAGTPLLHLTGQVENLAGCGYRVYSRNPRSADLPESQFETRVSHQQRQPGDRHFAQGDSGSADAAVRAGIGGDPD